MEEEMGARELDCRLHRYSIYLFIFGLYMLGVQSGFAQMRRGPKLNLPDSSVVHGVEKPRSPAAAPVATPANSTGPTVLQVAGDVYEYNYLLPTGTGRYHSVGLHRVVQVRNGRPIPSHNAAFLAHGSAGSFDGFMNADKPTQSLAVYLASNGVDVWGIDYGWALAPLSEADFTFMQNWGLQRDIDDLEAAIGFARVIRAATEGDGGRLALLGFSFSGGTGFALINQEAKRSCRARQVNAYIPIDFAFLTNDPSTQAASCGGESFLRQYVSQGNYYDDSGSYYEIIGNLAQTDPNGLSSVLPPYTNLQSSLVLGAAPWLFEELIPPYGHYVAGEFGPGGIDSIPIGLQYSSVSTWNKALASTTPYQPILEEAELAGITCGDANPSYSDSLSLVRIPVLYIGAAGGEGDLGLYTLTELGSRDIQHDIVSFYPSDEAWLDYGHFDLMSADNAKDVVWSRILHWLQDHEEDESCSE
jgi:hypothetical protein